MSGRESYMKTSKEQDGHICSWLCACVTRLLKLLPAAAMTSGLIAFDPELQPKGILYLPVLFLAKAFHHIRIKDTGTVGQIRDWNLKTPFREGYSFNNPTPSPSHYAPPQRVP